MGAAASAGKKRLFYKGVTISKYYKSYIERPMSELIAVLHMTSPQMKTLFGQFAVIDADSSGEVSLEEFYTQVKITRSRFVERVFGIFDLDASGMLNFQEFILGIWNLCTMTVRSAREPQPAGAEAEGEGGGVWGS